MVWTAQKLQYGSPKMPVLRRAFAKPMVIFNSFLVTVVLLVFDCILNVYRYSLYTNVVVRRLLSLSLRCCWSGEWRQIRDQATTASPQPYHWLDTKANLKTSSTQLRALRRFNTTYLLTGPSEKLYSNIICSTPNNTSLSELPFNAEDKSTRIFDIPVLIRQRTDSQRSPHSDKIPRLRNTTERQLIILNTSPAATDTHIYYLPLLIEPYRLFTF